MDKEKLFEDCMKSLREDFHKSDAQIKLRNYEEQVREHIDNNTLSERLSGYALATMILSENGERIALERFLY